MSRSRLILNRYAPLAKAGSGGFGTVEVAWDTRIQRKVAIKCIHLETPSDAVEEYSTADARQTVRIGGVDASRTQVVDPADGVAVVGESDDYTAAARAYLRIPGLDEARTAALLNDASIVSVYDFEVQGQTAYLIMEYVEGFTLARILRDYGDGLTLDIVASIFDGVARALEVAHDSHVLHLDIKPDNILVDAKGRVKVTDFGLAKLAGAGGFGSAGGGTIGYMPLEQMRGEPLDARCDEWALASVTYEMLTGENPFLADSLSRAERAVSEAELVLPSLCWEGLDEQADDVLFYALDPDREERYETVADFAEEMRKFLGDAKKGRRELASLLAGDGSDRDHAEGQPSTPDRAPVLSWDERVGEIPRGILGRLVAVAGTALVTGLGLGSLPGIDDAGGPLFWGVLVVACAIAAVFPIAGPLVAYAVLAAALIAQGALAQGCILVVVAGAWWWLAGRGGMSQANIGLSVPLAGAFGAAVAAPLAAGCVLRPVQAVISAAFGAFTAALLSSLGSGSLAGWDVLASWGFAGEGTNTMAYLVAVAPDTWVTAAGWVAAAAVASFFSLRASRPFRLAGVLTAGAVLVGAACAARGVASGGATFAPDAGELASILLCTAAVAVLAWVFPPRDD